MNIPTNLPQLQESLVRNIDTIERIIIIVVLTWIIQRLAIWTLLRRAKNADSYSSIVIVMVRWSVWLVGAVFVLHAINQPVTPIITALGVGGLAVALGLQETIANVFAGLNILASKKMSIGDDVELPTKKRGIVSDITWRHTLLKDEENGALIIIPNSYIVKEVMTNYGKPVKKKKK